MKTKRNLIQLCPLLPALWLALGFGLYAFPAGAQITTDGNRGLVSLTIQQAPGFYIATDFSPNGANEFVTNVSSSLFAVSATAAQNTHIEPARIHGTESASCYAFINGEGTYNYAGVRNSFFVQGGVTQSMRFLLTAQIAGSGSVLHFQSGPDQVQQTWVDFNGAGSTNFTVAGCVTNGDSFQFLASETLDAFSVNHDPELTASFSFDLQFDPLPAGGNELLGQLLGGGDMRFTYVGSAGTNYVLDRTFNLSPPINWVPQLTNAADPSGVLVLTNTPVSTTNNFWRVRSVP